jgi:hypothetical protein
MSITLGYLKGKRSWVVEDFEVWGELNLAEFIIFYTQAGEDSKRVVFNHSLLGGEEQSVSFASLCDFKGNPLPQIINHPKVIILPKREPACFVIGKETNTGFKVAKAANSSGNGLADLLIMEMG